MGPCSVCIPGMIAEVKKKALLQFKNAVDEHYTSTGTAVTRRNEYFPVTMQN